MNQRILIVDDDASYRAMLQRLFCKAGYAVSVAENGKEALRLQKEQPAQLIVTDLIMPDKEGIETILDFRKQYPATRIIAMSGGGRIPSRQYLELAESLGAQKTFAKPFNTSHLLDAVRELLAR